MNLTFTDFTASAETNSEFAWGSGTSNPRGGSRGDVVGGSASTPTVKYGDYQ